MWRIQPHKFKYFQQVRLQYGLRCARQVPRTWEYKMKELEEGVIFRQRERPTIGGLFEWFNRYSQHQHHSTIKHLAIFRNISRDSKTKSDTYHHHSEKLWSSGDQFHPWTFKLLPWWPQVAICGSLSTFFLEHTSKHGTKNWTCCFNSVGKSRHDFVFKSKVYIPLLYK